MEELGSLLLDEGRDGLLGSTQDSVHVRAGR